MRECRLHHGLGRISGDIAHDDAAGGCGIEVNIVRTGGRHADETQLRCPVHKHGIYRDLVDYQHFAVTYPFERLLPGAVVVAGILTEGAQSVQAGVSHGTFVKIYYFHPMQLFIA